MPPTRRLRSVHRRRHGGKQHPRSRREQRDILLQRAKQRAGLENIPPQRVIKPPTEASDD